MTRKVRVKYVCQACGHSSGKWLGRCPACDAWNSFAEEIDRPTENSLSPEALPIVQPLRQVAETPDTKRISTGMGELDRVLGGGLFPGSVLLVAGEPGIGKSTLMLQVARQITAEGRPVLYISGEESLLQLKHRAARLKPSARQVVAVAETRLPIILGLLQTHAPQVAIVDSIQSIYHPELPGAPGNMAQIRECSAQLFRVAKEQGITVIFIGHVTKEGVAAGPRLLEHLVDATLYFEGNVLQHRIIRAYKNRFGPAGELAVLEMTATGLRPVTDVGGLFLSHAAQFTAGTAIVCALEGSRPFLVEVQALVSRTQYGAPQRTASGFDHRRMALLLAILQRYTGLNFSYSDVFLKVAGGLVLRDPGIDLAVAMAIGSSIQEQTLSPDEVFLGELGLGGEVRAVSYLEQRLKEIHKRGLRQVFVPRANFDHLKLGQWKGLLISPVAHISELLPAPGQKKSSGKHSHE